MRIFTAAVAALLAVLSVAIAEGEYGSVHSLAIPVSQGQSSGTYSAASLQLVPLSFSTLSQRAQAPGLAATANILAATSGEVMLQQNGDKLLCDCGPGYCCLESGENTRCVELAASICASPFTPAAGFISQGTGEVVTLPTATSTLRMEDLDPVLTQSARIEDRSSTSQGSTVSQDDALGKGGSAPSVTSTGLGEQPMETHATASIVAEPTCDDSGCCTFPPSWTACQGGYLTKVNEDILTSTQTPSSEPSGEKLSQTILGFDDNKLATRMFSTSTSNNRAGETFVVVQPVVILNQKAGTDRERLDFSAVTSIRPFPTPSHYRISLDGQCGIVADTTCDGSYFGYCCGPDNTCGDDKDHCAPENCNPSVLYGRCWSPAWNTSTNDNSDHRRRDDLTASNSSTTEVATVHETSVVDVSNASTSSTGESSKSIARGSSDVPASSMEMSAVDHSRTHDGVSIHTIVDATVTEVVTAGEESSNNLLASMSTSTSTTTITNNITLTNPLNPAATTVVPADYTRQNISNTSINTEIFVNISTFSATGLTISSTEVSTTGATALETGLASSETSISSKVIRPSATETQPFNNGPQDFSPAATTNIGGQNHSSEGVKTTGGDGAFYMIAAVLGLAEIGGLMLLM